MKHKVLIVEDEVLIGMMIKKKVAAQGYDVCDISTTGEDALVQTANEKPDMVLMDICLAGDINGIEAARMIKNQFSIPIVFFTGNNKDKMLIDQSRDVNPVAIVDKLGPIEELFIAIQKAVTTHH